MFSHIALEKTIKLLKSRSSPRLLDVGSGDGEHAKLFLDAGLHVTALDIKKPNIKHENFTFNFGFLENYATDKSYDCIWMSHVLEHTLDPHVFLTATRRHLKPDGYLVITVPPLKHQIVGGHINLFNAGILMYRLILAGYDCSKAMIKTYGYNISIIVRNDFADFSYNELKFDNGDIETLSRFFPPGYNKQGFNGDIKELNWFSKYE